MFEIKRKNFISNFKTKMTVDAIHSVNTLDGELTQDRCVLPIQASL